MKRSTAGDPVTTQRTSFHHCLQREWERERKVKVKVKVKVKEREREREREKQRERKKENGRRKESGVWREVCGEGVRSGMHN